VPLVAATRAPHAEIPRFCGEKRVPDSEPLARLPVRAGPRFARVANTLRCDEFPRVQRRSLGQPLMNAPTSSVHRDDHRDALTFGILAVTVFAVPIFFGVPYSIGIVGALRILDGDIPYRDFWTMYAPGHFYLLAGLFLVFGKHLVIASAARAVVIAASGSVLFLIARDLKMTRQGAATVAGLFVLMLWKPELGLGTYEPALLFILIAWLVLVRSGAPLSARAALAAGVSVGVAAWFKHDIAAYAAMAMILGLFVEHLGGTRRGQWFETTRNAVLISAGAAAMVVPVALWCWLVAGRDALQDVILFPVTDFPKLRRTVYPGFLPAVSRMTDLQSIVETAATWCRFNIPALLWLGWAVALVRGRTRRRSPPQSWVGLLIASFMFFWLAAHVRVSTHISTISAIALLLGGVAWTRSRTLPTGPLRLAASSVAFAFGASLLLDPAKAVAHVAHDWPTSRSSSIPSLRGLIVPASDLEYYEPIAQLVERSIPERERLYVGMLRHDAVISSNPMVYAVVGRRGASRFDELHAAVADRADVQREIIDAIERSGVRLAVLWQFGRSTRALDQLKAERSRQLPKSGATVLDEFLAREFRPIAQHGEYHVRWRVDVPDP
jgi:hypothetical protein